MARRRGAELSDLGLRRPVAPGRRLDRWRRDVGDDGLLQAIKGLLDDLPQRVERGAGLLISGKHRCGKTFALDVVDAEATQAGFAAAHESEEGFRRALRATYGRAASHTERDVIAAVSRADILIIDDLGAAPSTEWGASATERLVDAAYQARVPIVAATRLSDPNLAATLTRHAYACVVERAASIALPDRDLTAALRDATRRALETTKEG